MGFLGLALFAAIGVLESPAVLPSSAAVAEEQLVGPFAWDDNPSDNEAVLAAERLSRKGGDSRVLKWAFRGDGPLPESCYAEALKLRRLVKAYSTKWDVYHLESIPTNAADSVAMKRCLRLAIMDAARELDSSLELFCKRDVTASRLKTEDGLTQATFKCRREPYVFVWRSDVPPSDEPQIVTNDLTALVAEMKEPVRVELLTGEVERLENPAEVIVSDSPILLAPQALVPMKVVWEDLYPRGMLPIFDLYGRNKLEKFFTPPENEELEPPPVAATRDEFGGNTLGPQLKATGRFRIAHVNGKWSLVDPDGHLYRAWGPMAVVSARATPLDGNLREVPIGRPQGDRDGLFTWLPKFTGETTEADEPYTVFYESIDPHQADEFRERKVTRHFDFFGANLYRQYGADWFGCYADLLHRRIRAWGLTAIGPESDERLLLNRQTPYVLTVNTAADLSRYEAVKGDKWCLGVYVKNGCGLKATQTAVKAFDPHVLYFGDSARYCDVATVKVKRDMPQIRFISSPDAYASAWSEPHTVGVFFPPFVDLRNTPDPARVELLHSLDLYSL